MNNSVFTKRKTAVTATLKLFITVRRNYFNITRATVRLNKIQ